MHALGARNAPQNIKLTGVSCYCNDATRSTNGRYCLEMCLSEILGTSYASVHVREVVDGDGQHAGAVRNCTGVFSNQCHCISQPRAGMLYETT